MSKMQPIIRKSGGLASLDEARQWIDRTLAANSELEPVGIAVSNELFQQGLNDRYRDIPVAMSPEKWPDLEVHIRFRTPD